MIDALGLSLPVREFEINGLNLVIQHGPERRWDWTVLSTVELEEMPTQEA
jgi:hypothetical protein